MKNTQRRAFILNECNSPYIAQAIFILRSGVSGEESGVLADAERIVASYMNNDFKPLPVHKRGLGRPLYFLLSGFGLAAALAVCLVLRAAV